MTVEPELNLLPAIDDCAMKGALAAVIPAFRCEKTIVATLDSLNAQHRKADIVLVVLDEPNPGLEAICRAHNINAEIIVNPRNLGLAATRNIGFDHVRDRAEYICFLDADDILHPDFLLVAYEQIASGPDIDGVFGGFLQWQEGTLRPPLPPLTSHSIDILDDALDTYLTHTGSFIHSFALLRTSSIAAVAIDGKINVESLRNNEDFEFFARLFFKGTIARIKDRCGWYRKSPNSQSSNQLHARHFRVAAARLLYSWLEAQQADGSVLQRIKSIEHSATRHLARLHWQKGERKKATRLLLASTAKLEWKSFAQLMVLCLGIRPFIQRTKESRASGSPRSPSS